MSSNAHIQVHPAARGHRKSVQLPQTSALATAERDRKRSAPPATSHLVDETPRPRSVNSRRSSSALSRDDRASPTPRKVRLPPPPVSEGYVNTAYVGSVVGSVRSVPTALHLSADLQETGVIREQYCSCARWSRLERMLLVVVAVLAGLVVGLIALVTVLAIADPDSSTGLLRHAPPVTTSAASY